MSISLIKPDLPTAEQLKVQIDEVLKSGRITNFGKYVSQFEQTATSYLGTHVSTISSGTLGLLFTLQALGLSRDAVVILPSFTFMATAQAILYAGGIPVFAEVTDDLTMDVEDLDHLLQSHPDTALVLPVHLYGLPCKVDEIARVVDEASRRAGRKIPIVYDAAHACGSAIGDRKVGTFGDAEVFSLSVTKVLVSVEGGMVSSNSPDLIQRIKKMRNYGIEANYDAHYPGMNGKMSELHAIVGLHNLRRLDQLLAERKKKARYYIDRIERATSFRVTAWPAGVVHTFKDFTIFVPPGHSDQRDAVMTLLKERGIETRAYFSPPVHQQKFFSRFADRPLPRTDDLASRVITLPFYTTITEDEMNYVAHALEIADRELIRK